MWTFGQQVVNGLVVGMGYSIFAMGLTLIFGMMRVINMAHGEFFMMGAMLIFTMTAVLHIPFFLALILAAAIVALFSIIFDRIAVQPLLNTQPLNVMISSMAISVIMVNLATIVWNTDTRNIPTPFSGQYTFAGVTISQTALALSLIGIGALVALWFFIEKTPTGRIMRAVAQDETGAALIGINVRAIYSITIAVSGALAAIAGGIIGPIWSAFPTMGENILLKGFAVIIVAGMGSARGAVLVGLGLGVSEALFGQYVSTAYTSAFAFSLLVLMCLIRPQGLFKNA